MRAHVVKCFDRIRVRTHDQDRLVTYLVRDVVADVRNLFDATSVLPDLRPKLVSLSLRVLLGQIYVRVEDKRLLQIFDADVVAHVTSSRKSSPLLGGGVSGSARSI